MRKPQNTFGIEVAYIPTYTAYFSHINMIFNEDFNKLFRRSFVTAVNLKMLTD